MNNFPVIVISHINNCELASYFRGECDWKHCKDANTETGIFNSIEEIANHIVKLDREFFDEVHRSHFYGDFEEKIAKNITKEHDPKYEYSHLIISKSSFTDENFCINGENGNLSVPTDWDFKEQLVELIRQKKKAATENRLVNEKKQKQEQEQQQKEQEKIAQEQAKIKQEEIDRQTYERLKMKYEGQ